MASPSEGNVLKLAREFQGLNQTEFARQLNLKNSYVSEIENGKRPVSLKILRRYAEALSIPASSLLFFMEEISSDGDERTFVLSRGKIEGAASKMLQWIAERLDE